MFCLVAIVITLNSAFQFGESLVEWSRSSYLNTFASFSDNIVQTSFQERMCLPIPIDIVYTWVNGSDPKLIEGSEFYLFIFLFIYLIFLKKNFISLSINF